MVLGYSRIKYLKVTTNRSQKALFNCMISAFKYFGGLPQEILSNNMKTVIDRSRTSFSNVEFNTTFKHFSDDAGFNEEINNELSQVIDDIPLNLLNKGSEYLKPLPPLDLLASYVSCEKEYKVSKESMTNYKGKKYSVLTKYISFKVNIIENSDGNISIYYNEDFILCHSLSNKKYNYKIGHMQEILKSDACKHLSNSETDDFIRENMFKMDILLGE